MGRKGKSSFPNSANFGGGMVFHAGTVNTCSSTDSSWYCALSRMVASIQGLFSIFIIFIALYFIYTWAKSHGWLSFGK